MHSRLYRRVLNQYEWVHNCTAFSSLYNNSGLVGVFISVERARSGQIFDIITKEIQVRSHAFRIQQALYLRLTLCCGKLAVLSLSQRLLLIQCEPEGVKQLMCRGMCFCCVPSSAKGAIYYMGSAMAQLEVST